MEIERDVVNGLLNRREILAIKEFESNPGFEGVIAALADKFKVTPEMIAVKSLQNNFGSNLFAIEAYIYKSLEDKARFEPKKKGKGVPGAAPTAAAGGSNMPTMKGGSTKERKGKKPHKNKPTSKKYAFYSNDGDNIKKLGKSCPRCGPAVFLANHGSRLYCGKCHYTEFNEKK